MTCSFDIKEYALGECAPDDAPRVRAHIARCAECRDELARLELTRASLLSLRDEELPRRIAFVSDKIFDPRWRHRLWNSGPLLGFAAVLLLTCAILVHAFARPGLPPAQPMSALLDSKPIEDRVRREVAARMVSLVQVAVAEAVEASEQRQSRETARLLQAAEARHELDRRATLEAVSEQTRLLQKQVSSMYITAQNMRSGE